MNRIAGTVILVFVFCFGCADARYEKSDVIAQKGTLEVKHTAAYSYASMCFDVIEGTMSACLKHEPAHYNVNFRWNGGEIGLDNKAMFEKYSPLAGKELNILFTETYRVYTQDGREVKVLTSRELIDAYPGPLIKETQSLKK